MGPSLQVAKVVAVMLMCCSILSSGEWFGAQECEDLGFTELTLCLDCNALTDAHLPLAASWLSWLMILSLLIRFAI
jgi:hypothetical protein